MPKKSNFSQQAGKVSPLARNFSALFSTQAITRVIHFLYFIVIARVLSPEMVGIYSYGIAFYISLKTFTNFGQEEFLAIQLNKRPRLASQLISHSFTIRLFTTIVTVSTGLVFAWLHEDNPLTVWALTWFLAALAARSLAMWVRFCCVAIEDALWIPRYELVFRGSEAVLGTGILVLNANVLMLCGLHFLIWALEACFAFRLLRKRIGFKFQPGRKSRLLKKIAWFSTMFMLSFGFLDLLNQIGIVMLKFLQPNTIVVGYFGIAMQFLTTLLILPATFGTAVLPAIGRVQQRGDLSEISALQIVVKASLVIGGIVAIAANAYAPWLITSILGLKYIAAAKTFALLTWTLGPYSVAIIIGKTLNALARPLHAAAMAITMVIMNMTVMAIFISWGGLEAAMIALFAATLTGCMLGLIFLHTRLGFSGHHWWLRPMGLAVAFGVLSQGELLPNVWIAPVWCGVFLLFVWKFHVFTKPELTFILKRLGIG